MEFSCEIMTIYYLDPIYIFVKDNLYYFSMRLISFLLFDFYLIQFIIQEIAEIFAILGYSVYLEIIELRFLGLDDNLKKNIIKRGTKEVINISTVDEGDESFQNENPNNCNES